MFKGSEKESSNRELAEKAGQCLSIWKGHKGSVTALAVLEQGRRGKPLVVSASWDNTIKCWEMDEKTGKAQCLSAWEGHAYGVNALAVLEQGERGKRLVLSGSDDNTIMCWQMDEKTGKAQCLSTWEGHKGSVYALAVLEQGGLGKRLVVSASHDKTIKCWEMDEKTGKARCLSTWEGHTGSVRALAVLEQGGLGKRLVLSAGDNTIKCWQMDEKTGEAQCLSTWEGHTGSVRALAVLEQGGLGKRLVVSASHDKTIKCWEMDEKTGKAECLSTWEGHTHWVRALAVLEQGERGKPLVLSASMDKTIKCWQMDEKTGKAECLSTWKGHKRGVFALVVLEQGERGKQLVLSGSGDETIKCWQGFPVPQAVQEQKKAARQEKRLAFEKQHGLVPIRGAQGVKAEEGANVSASSSVSKKSRSEEESVGKKEKAGKEKKEKRTKKKEGPSKKKSSRRHRDSEAALPALPKGEVKALQGYLAPADSGQLSLRSGETLTLLSDEGNWWRCRNESAAEGLVPSNYVKKVVTSTSTDSPLPSMPSPLPELPAKPAAAAASIASSSESDKPSDKTSSQPSVSEGQSTSGGAPTVTPSPSSGRLKAALASAEQRSTSSFESGGGSSFGSKEKVSSESRGGSSTLLLDAQGKAQVDPVLAYEDLTFGKVLGAGGFGEVYKGQWQGVDVAIKKLLQKHLTEAMESTFRKEAGVMVQLRGTHPNIINMYGIVLVPEPCMVLEFMGRGALDGLLHGKVPMSWEMRYTIGLDVARGLFYLHNKRILHLDLKSMNVLMAKDGTAKLADFGLSEIKGSTSQQSAWGDESKKAGGTLRWMAPELFRGGRYRPSCDVYSFAMVLWELASRQVPYRYQLNAAIPEYVKTGGREAVPVDTPASVQALMVRCWAADASTRPKMGEVMKDLQAHPVTDETPIPSPHLSGVDDEDVWSDEETTESDGYAMGRTAPQPAAPTSQAAAVESVDYAVRSEVPGVLPSASPSSSSQSKASTSQAQSVDAYYAGRSDVYGGTSSSGSSATLFQAAAPPPPLPDDEDDVLEAGRDGELPCARGESVVVCQGSDVNRA